MEIEDAGEGISPEKEPVLELSAHAGVGLRVVRERLRPLGGTLHIHINNAERWLPRFYPSRLRAR